MKILCGTDFSMHAQEAGRAAAAIAARLKSELILVHVLDTSRYSDLSSELHEHFRHSRQGKLELEARRLERDGLTIHTQLIEGSPATSLVEAALDSGAGMIVVSSVGQIAPSRWFVGSVAERTAQNASVPTLVVRDHGSLESWAQEKTPLNVIVGYDFSPSGDAALAWSASLNKIAPCKLRVTYIVGREAEHRTPWSSGGDTYWPSAIKELIIRDLDEAAKRTLGDVESTVNVFAGVGRPDPQLIELAQAEMADLIVIGTNQKRGVNLLGSVSRGILHHASMNVLCVPIGAADATKSNESKGGTD
jgi:nucleotide-binding universal stress UspA family protein